jgi:hypothetical protein
MSGRRWFHIHPVLVIWCVLMPGRKAWPWIMENFDVILPCLVVVAIAFGIIWVFRKPAPVPAVEGPHPGVVVLEVKELAPARCLTCREGLSGDVVRCGRCRTPHHRDCFRYIGTCSVYACGGKQARPAA